MASENTPKKRKIPQEIDNPPSDDSDGEVIGPLISEAENTKKRKVLQFEGIYLDNLPKSETYERSFMHRDIVSHVVVTKTNFVITTSADGHIKFWKKVEDAIEFVKHIRGHMGEIKAVSANYNGALFCTAGADMALKVFDVINFDMINMIKLEYVPGCCEWVHVARDALPALAVSELTSGKIHIYDGKGNSTPMLSLDKLHKQPVIVMKYNHVFEMGVSVDRQGMVEYWSSPKKDCVFPKGLKFDSKLDTDLYEFVKNKCRPTSVSFTPDGKHFATIATDRKVRVFKFLTGKLYRVYDESLQRFTELQQAKQLLPNMEFGRRMAGERDLDKSDAFEHANIIYDETGNFILYPTMLGVKVINIYTNRCVRVIGKPENIRILQLALFQGNTKKRNAATTVELEASDNPALETEPCDPTLFVTAVKKNRFYLFTKREPSDTTSVDGERDVFNEKPSKEDIVAATEASGSQRLYEKCIIHTNLGDITCTLFPKECPKTVENFCVHSKNGYFNGHVFHRVIKSFMVQTGDPLGTGTGGESIWGGEFEDEFHPSLRHDRPYTLSMANAGANTNGSQFFITVIPTPWLDNKHTVFGRVTKGMEVVQSISNVKTHPKTDKPYEDICIVSITMR